MPTRRKRASGISRWAWGVLLLAPGLGASGIPATPAAETAPPAAAQPPALRGRPLAEALLELNAMGLEIVFTSRVVGPEMRVESEPPAGDPRQILDALLAPHGLRAEDGPGGVVIVVPVAAVEASGIAGVVRSRETREPLAGATVRVAGVGAAARTDAAGRFEMADLAPGTYTLEAELAGFLAAQAPGVAVRSGRPAAVTIELQPVPFILDEIVVRPSRLSLLEEEPAAPLSLSREEIDGLPHLAGDPFRALSLLPGTAANDFTAQLHVHGGRRDEVQILLDGQELYEAFHLPDYDRAMSVVAPGGLSDASLSTGAFPASYGDRMSGVLDMTTAAPADPRRTRLSLSFLSALASSGGGFAGDRGSWLATARRGSIDLASRLLGDEDPAFWDFFGKLGYRLGDRHHLRGHFLRAGDRLSLREASADGESKHFDTEYDSAYLWLTHRATIGERLLAETAVSATRLDRDRRGAEDEEELDFEIADHRTFDVLGASQSWSLQATPRHTLEWGFEARRYQAGYDYAARIEPELVLQSELTAHREPAVRFAETLSGDHLGVYGSGRVSLLEPLTVELGLRYDRHPLTADTLLSPRVNLAWRLGNAGVVRASWGHFHQSQRPYELQVEDGETRFFEAERSEHWVIGFERLFGRRDRAPVSALRLELYRRRIDDPRPRYENLFEPLNTFPEAEHDRARIAPSSSRSQGVELLLRGAAGPRVEWSASYAYATAEDRIGGADVPRATDQPHTLNLLVHGRLGKGWSLSVAWRFHTGWPTTPVFTREAVDEEGEPELVAVLGRLNSERFPDYHRMDLRASRAWDLPSGRLTFFLDLQNLYDRKNLAGFDLALDEEAGGLVTEEERWPGFFPSLGLTWEF